MAKEVLVVDDNATIRSLSRKVLEGLNFNVTEAVDGQAGLERAQEASFHLILADINMPRMNGIDMIRHIRALPGYARVPVLIISTENSPAIMAKGKEAGANGWLVKPFQREKLLGILKKLVKA